MAKPYDHTSLGGTSRQFPQTAWTRMLDYGRREEVLAELCQAYWKPVYRYLRAMGFGNEQAKDLVQGFFTDKVLGQDFVQKADRRKGRFRSFLLRSVHNYAVNVQRNDRTPQSLDTDREDHRSAGNPEAEFNRAWADVLFQDVLAELKSECYQRGKETHWHVFHDWLLDPQIEQSKTMSEICRQYDVSEPSKAYHMIENLKRRFRALLRSRLGQVVASDADVENEIREFIELFSSDAARS